MSRLRDIVDDEIDRLFAALSDKGPIGIYLDELSNEAQVSLIAWKYTPMLSDLRKNKKIIKELIAFVKRNEMYDMQGSGDIRKEPIFRGIKLDVDKVLPDIIKNGNIDLYKQTVESWAVSHAESALFFLSFYVHDYKEDDLAFVVRRPKLRGNVIWNFMSDGGLSETRLNSRSYHSGHQREILLPNQCTKCKGKEVTHLLINSENVLDKVYSDMIRIYKWEVDEDMWDMDLPVTLEVDHRRKKLVIST